MCLAKVTGPWRPAACAQPIRNELACSLVVPCDGAVGANLICFITDGDQACGRAPSPSLKLGTNTALWVRQEDGIDCGKTTAAKRPTAWR